MPSFPIRRNGALALSLAATVAACLSNSPLDSGSPSTTAMATTSGTAASTSSYKAPIAHVELITHCDTTDDLCQSCVSQVCCERYVQCAQTPGCRAAFDCALSCAAEDQECVPNCVAAYPGAKDAINTYAGCFFQAYIEVCGAACTNDSGTTASVPFVLTRAVCVEVEAVPPDTAACASCAYNACCDFTHACLQDVQGCAALHTCAVNCGAMQPQSTTCTQQCETRYDAAEVETWRAMVDCAAERRSQCTCE